MEEGYKNNFSRERNEQRGVIPSDLVFIIDEKPHSIFKRDSHDLVVTQKISLAEALTCYTVQLTTLDGRNLMIPINSVISPTYEVVVKGEGMPIPKEPTRKGTCTIKFNIKFLEKAYFRAENWSQAIVDVLMSRTLYKNSCKLCIYFLYLVYFWTENSCVAELWILLELFVRIIEIYIYTFFVSPFSLCICVFDRGSF